MATMAPPNSAPPVEGAPAQPMAMEPPPDVTKALNQTVQGLASLYMACHKMEPDSPLCNAVMELQKAVAEVGNNIGMPTASADAPMAEGDPAMAGAPEDPMAGGMPAEDPMAGGMPAEEEPLPPGYSIEDAAGDTQSMMQEAAKRRLGQ